MKIFFTVILLSASFLKLAAQTNNSPYSILGIGDIDDSYYNRTSGMANTGIAYRSNRYLIGNNPASFSGLDNDFFIGELAGRATFINYYGQSVSTNANQSFDITFKKLILGIKPAKHWGTSVGLVPFSSQNYEFNAAISLDGSAGTIANQYFKGSGGLNKAYWANSYEFFHHLSLGVSASYLFGSLQQKIILQDASGTELASTNNTAYISNFYFDYGMQFYTAIGKRWNVSLGATFANKTRLNADISQTVLAPDSSTLYGSSYPWSSFTLPTTYGAGLALTYNNKYTFLADYKSQNWLGAKNAPYNPIMNTGGYNYSFQNSNRYSAGFEISKKRMVSIGQYNALIELMYFQAGVYYGNTYLNVYDQSIKDKGITLGIGVNSKRTALSYAFSFQYGIRGVQSVQLVEEKYASFTLAISFGDFWRTKGRKFY